MSILFVFSDIDGCRLGFSMAIGLTIGLPTAVSCFYLASRLVRWWNARPVSRCPRCKAAPAALDVLNVCGNCGCEYDKWGNLLKEPPPPPQLDALDLARFDAKRKQTDPDDDRYRRPGMTQEPTP